MTPAPSSTTPRSTSRPTDTHRTVGRVGELTEQGSGLRHAVALARRSLIKTWRTPEALVDVTLQPVIFILMFTYIFGGAIGGAMGGGAGGSHEAYLQFLLPGIIGQMIAMSGISLGVNLNTDIEKGVFDRFRSLPISRSAPLVGSVLADVVRSLLLFTVCLATGLIAGFRVGTGPLSVLAALGISVAFALCFCWISVWVGMIARTSGAVQGIMFMLVLPLSFVSNAFVPTDTMPSWLGHIADVNPLSHLVGTVRGLMVGGPVASDLLWTLGWMGLLLLVFVPLALRAYRRRA